MNTQSTRILIITVVTLALLSSCSRWGPNVDCVAPAFLAQIRSLSVPGPQMASVVLERTRELKITTDGGLTWQTIPAAAVADAFESVTLLDERRGWAVNHQGHVFNTDSGGTKWNRISE